MSKYKLRCGDNIELLKKMPDNSVDAVVSDPPYGLSFMGKKWDHDVPSVEFWKEVYRVLKPGGHVLSFGGTRTYHRLVVNIEDAGFEIRDQIMWLYGSGFPKSHNIGKAVDKLQGNEREVVGEVKQHNIKGDKLNYTTIYDKPEYDTIQQTKGTSAWEGWGTALKPSNEPICLARKPLSEKSVAENVLKWGTGGINVDGCRVGSELRTTPIHSDDIKDDNTLFGLHKTIQHERVETTEGRFPANIILECICDEVIKGEKGERSGARDNYGDKEGGHWGQGKQIRGADYNDKGDIHTDPMCPCRLMDEQSGVLKSGDGKSGKHKINRNGNTDGVCKMDMGSSSEAIHYGDKGGASRFFYQAKVSKKERNMGLPEGMKSTHPTMKPVQLMSYLCRLITPPGGTILDPYMGSGSTGIAALLEGFNFIGFDLDPDYVKIAEARIANYEKYREFLKK